MTREGDRVDVIGRRGLPLERLARQGDMFSVFVFFVSHIIVFIAAGGCRKEVVSFLAGTVEREYGREWNAAHTPLRTTGGDKKKPRDRF